MRFVLTYWQSTGRSAYGQRCCWVFQNLDAGIGRCAVHIACSRRSVGACNCMQRAAGRVLHSRVAVITRHQTRAPQHFFLGTTVGIPLSGVLIRKVLQVDGVTYPSTLSLHLGK
jgi:hypothetical protein